MRIVRLLWLLPATVALVAAAALVPRLGDDQPAPGEAHVTVQGLARVTRAGGGGVERVRDATELRRGDRLAMLQGRAELELSDDVDYEARASEDPEQSTALTMGTVPVLHAGELLVTAEDDASLVAAGTRVQLEATEEGAGALRLSRSLAVAVEVYRGVADVDSAGERGRVAAFRQLEVPAFGDVPQRAEPLNFVNTDDWDRRFLREAIGIDQNLVPKLRSFPSVQRTGSTASFLESVLPTKPDASTLEPLLESRSDEGDTLAGATITDLSSQPSSFTSTWHKVFDFHDEGATWGLVALDRAVAEARLADVVDGALERDEVEVAVGQGPSDDRSSARPVLSLNGPGTGAVPPPLLPPLDPTTTTVPPTTESESTTTTTESTTTFTTDTRCCSTSTSTTTTTTTTEPTTTTTIENRTSSTTVPTTTTLPPTTAAVPVTAPSGPTPAEDGAEAAVMGATED